MKISYKRKETINQLTSYLVKNYGKIVIEDLNVSGMMKNKSLSRAISDVGFRMFRDQLECKCKWNNVELLVADRFFPSTKLCSSCGIKKKNMPLYQRTYNCSCGLSIDRDLNAALNLKNYKAVAGSAKTKNVSGGNGGSPMKQKKMI